MFHWQTGGLEITSTVEEVDAPHRIVWGGPAQGIVAVHVWALSEIEGAVLVRTEESWKASLSKPKSRPCRAYSTDRFAPGSRI